MNTLANISIIIPFAPEDMAWQALLSDLTGLPDSTEIILIAASEEARKQAMHVTDQRKIQVANSLLGRGLQMNTGAKLAKNACLWFLHADSRVDTTCLKEIDAFNFEKRQLGYFGLRFSNDGPSRMNINRFGVWFRSRFLKIPFGDQGFVIAKQHFEMLGTYREDLNAGEDHAFIWCARKNGVKLKAFNASILTSARKYSRLGWGKTTRQHLRDTWRQARQFSKQASPP
jgi:hypothetical protein